MSPQLDQGTRWIIASMVACTLVLLAGFYGIARYESNRVIREIRVGPNVDLILPDGNAKMESGLAPDIGVVREEWDKLWNPKTEPTAPALKPDTPIKLH